MDEDSDDHGAVLHAYGMAMFWWGESGNADFTPDYPQDVLLAAAKLTAILNRFGVPLTMRFTPPTDEDTIDGT